MTNQSIEQETENNNNNNNNNVPSSDDVAIVVDDVGVAFKPFYVGVNVVVVDKVKRKESFTQEAFDEAVARHFFFFCDDEMR